MPQLKPIELEDGTIIYIQAEENLSTTIGGMAGIPYITTGNTDCPCDHLRLAQSVQQHPGDRLQLTTCWTG